MSVTLSTYHEKIIDRVDDIVNNGFGKIYIEVKTLQDGTISFLIEYTKSDRLFERKRFNLDNVI